MALPVRLPRSRRRGRSIYRASAGISRTRLVAALALMVTGGSLYWLTTAEAFALDPSSIKLDGLRYTDAAVARAALGLEEDARPNLFRLRTSHLESALLALPPVRDARVEVELPDRLHVSVEERVPILVWAHGGTALLADVEGRLFAPAGADVGLPSIYDARTSTAVPQVGDRLDDLDLQAARLLGAVRPADLGSSAASLSLSIQDDEGWVMEAPIGWRAVFGHYTVSLRPPTSIEMQVACLRGLLATGEGAVEQVTLSLSDDRCGTFVPHATPSPPSSERSGAPPSRRP